MTARRLDEAQVLAHLGAWHAWVARRYQPPLPRELGANHWGRALPAVVLHVGLAVVRRLCFAVGAIRVAGLACRLRIRSDAWSFDPCACGLNTAWCQLGLAHLQVGQTDEAIRCLDEAWRVLPCPHNTSFGIDGDLCIALAAHIGASETVARYRRIAAAFVEGR